MITKEDIKRLKGGVQRPKKSPKKSSSKKNK